MTRNPDLPCADCGRMMWRKGNNLPVGEATCRPCRRARPSYRNSRAKRGTFERWTCGKCGRDCERVTTRGQRPRWCERCRRPGGGWIPDVVRFGIYERDRWRCGICAEPVDAGLIGSRSVWRPSLDHVLPKARGGPDTPLNLRLTHVWCNSVLSDGRVYTDDDLRGDGETQVA